MNGHHHSITNFSIFRKNYTKTVYVVTELKANFLKHIIAAFSSYRDATSYVSSRHPRNLIIQEIELDPEENNRIE